MKTRISFVFLLFALSGPERISAQNLPLDSINVDGARILSGSAILTVAGLKQGDSGGPATFDAGRDRLLATGYFDSVGYRYKSSPAHGFDLTFEVKEVTVFYPVRVEALQASTEEVVAYLKTREPLFSTGRMPGAKPVLDRSANEIYEFLAPRNPQVHVAGRVVATGPNRYEIQFTPERGLPAVAGVTFEGSRAISSGDLLNKMNEVAFGQPFSDSLFRALLDRQIRPLYEAKGYMRVKFSRILSKPARDVDGLDVKVTVDEGPQYRLSRVSVRPENAAELPRMSLASFDQIRDAAAKLMDELKHEGYLDADVTTDRDIDDATKTVAGFIVVDKGPLYTFGRLTVNGLGLNDEAEVRRMWSVKSGDPFPAEYAAHFASTIKKEAYFDNLSDVAAKPDIDSDTHVVNVTLDFKAIGKGIGKEAPRKPRF